MYSYYPPDWANLPHLQAFVNTSTTQEFIGFCKTFAYGGYRTCRIALVIGESGIGKSATIEHHVRNQHLQSHTALPKEVAVQVRPESTPQALSRDIASLLGERVKGRTGFDVVDEIVNVIRRNDLQVLYVDEADLMSSRCFEMIRNLHDRTYCRFILAGLPAIGNLVENQEKFESRIGMRLIFKPLEKSEIVETVLPQIQFPYWSFDPTQSSDLEMADLIHKYCGSSWRNLMNLLQTARDCVNRFGLDSIDCEIIEESQKWIRQQSTPKEPKSGYEADSDRRHDAKKR